MKTTSLRWNGRSGATGLAVLVAAGLAACDREGRGSTETDGGPLVLDASDVHILGTSDAIATVEDLEVLPDGTVWVLNSVEPFFVGFGADGEVLQTRGRSGGGPGELQEPAGFTDGGIDGAAWALDVGRHAFLQVSGPDTTSREIAIPPDPIRPGTVLGGMNLLSRRVRTARMEGEIVLPRASIEGEIPATSYWYYGWSPDLVALNFSTDEVRTVVRLAEILGDPRPSLLTGEYPPFPLWYRLWGVCGADEIRVYDQIQNQIRGFTSEGVEREPTALPPPSYEEVTPRQFARATFDLGAVERMGQVPPGPIQVTAADSAQIIQRITSRVTQSPEDLASLLPMYVDYRCDGAGTQWIQPIDLDIGGLRGGPIWLRLSPDGGAQEVRFPDRFDAYRFTSERVWEVQRDELGVASVAWIDLVEA
ncbi:MAG: hypothetical protein GEU90_02665 [Gemmatimonas sp.]|nr:hypothetical protein [Gemmatimonas sp.]